MAAITDGYITDDDYRAAKHDSGGRDGPELAADILAVSQIIDNEAGQFFTKDAAVVNRIWVGDGSNRLKVFGPGYCPGIATATGLIVKIDRDGDGSFADEDAVASGDYELRPLDAALGRLARPYTELVLHGLGSVTDYVWPRGLRVQVTAVYGWPEVPVGIKRLCIELLSLWRIEGSRATGMVQQDMATFMQTSREAQSMLRRALDPYWMPVVA